MKTYYVYELVNQEGKVEYIGETKRLKGRFKQHHSTQGKFNGRTDLKIKVIKEFNTRKEAREFEGEHKIKNGFEWTEYTKNIKGGKIIGKYNVESGHLDRIRTIEGSIKGGTKGGAIAKQTGQIYKLGKSNIQNGVLDKARKASRESTRKEIIAYEYKTNKFIGKFDALKDAANKLNVQTGHICSICKGNLHQTKGYTFKYA